MSSPALPAEVSAKAETTLTLLTEILKKAVAVSCGKITLDKALLEEAGKGSGIALFSGCTTKVGGITQEKCEPKAGAEKGVIATSALKSQLVQHEGATLNQVKPVTGETLAVISSSEECSIGEKTPVSGVLYLKDSTGKLEVEEDTHLVEQGPLTDLWVLNKTAEHKATIDGNARLSLSGAHLGIWWSGLG